MTAGIVQQSETSIWLKSPKPVTSLQVRVDEESRTRTKLTMPDSSDASPEDLKAGGHHVEQVHTNERVPGHANYYEKDGLRTYGDDMDHDHEPKMSFRRAMSLIAMAFRKSWYLEV